MMIDVDCTAMEECCVLPFELLNWKSNLFRRLQQSSCIVIFQVHFHCLYISHDNVVSPYSMNRISGNLYSEYTAHSWIPPGWKWIKRISYILKIYLHIHMRVFDESTTIMLDWFRCASTLSAGPWDKLRGQATITAAYPQYACFSASYALLIFYSKSFLDLDCCPENRS